jgi:hypothetical protein
MMNLVSMKMKTHKTYPRGVWWIVLSPVYEDHSGDYYEPPETVRDVMYVRSKSAHRAKVLAIRAWRRGKTVTSYVPYIVQDSTINPMAVLTAERVVLQ